MLVDVEIRERLSHYCIVTKQTQEKAANVALREMLPRCEQDPTMKAGMETCQNLASNNFCVGKTRIEAHLDAHFRTHPEL